MKRMLLIASCLMMMVGSVEAKPVGEGEARRVASAFLRTVAGVSDVELVRQASPYSGFYVFAVNDRGFILVSADDCVVPVLGYSLERPFRVEGMPSHVRAWMDRYEAEIGCRKGGGSGLVRAESGSADGASAQWSRLRMDVRPLGDVYTPVGPLMTTTWNQAPYYNAMTPYDESVHSYYQNHVVTGCVATATAQVMKYHNHPATGYGSHSYTHSTYGTQSANFGTTNYQWSNMPNALTSASSTAQVNAVATLMYHVGVADEMNYSNSASGASNYQSFGYIDPSSQNSLVSYFKYSPDMAVLPLDDLGSAEYSARLRAEMVAGRPALISGYDTTAGHSFVIDGYDAAGLFHVNWGWGGSCDGYYMVTNLEPAESGIGGNNGSYHMSEVALVGIRPNTSWGAGGTVTLSTDGTAGCSVTGGGSYAFGDTVTCRVSSVPEGYRFVKWNDGTPIPVREFVGTGGNYSYTAQFEQLHGDTLSYSSSLCIGTFGNTDGMWGIRLPSSVLEAGKELCAVQFYTKEAGSYTVKVFTGTTGPTQLAYSGTATVSVSEGWQTHQLSTPLTVSGSENIWLAIAHPTASVPATFGCGNSDAFLWGSDLNPYSGYAFMIRGIFHTATSAMGDTISYCGNSAFVTNITAGGNAFSWGIMLPASQLAGRNYLKGIKAYIGQGEQYTINVYTGATEPSTLLHTQAHVFGAGDTAWQEVALDATVAIPSGQNLWIFLTSTKASACNYTGDTNSDWLIYNNQLMNLQAAGTGLNFSWLLKAVTTATLPVLPAPTVYVSGPTVVMTGSAATFNATATSGASVSWTLAGATPSSATGATVTATWNTPGTYRVIATASNASGTGRDTLMVDVITCTTITSFPYEQNFDNPATLPCWTIIDADNDGYGWDFRTSDGIATSASYIDDVGVLTPDNWLVTPQMQFTAGANYKLTFMVRGTTDGYYAEHYGVYVSTTGTAPSDFTLLRENTLTNTNWYNDTVDLSSYAGQTVYVAFRHFNCTDQYWLALTGVMVRESRSIYNDGDTISYVGNNPYEGSINAGGTPFYWGIMLPASQLGGRNYLEAVNFFASSADNYTLYVFSGGTNSPSTLRYTQSVAVSNTGWQTMVLDTIQAIASGQNLWVVMYSPVASGSFHSGSTNSDWLSLDGNSWEHITGYDYNYSWMIKAVTSAAAPTYSVSVVSANPSMGSVNGGGSYASGTSITLTATAATGHHFVQWQDGNTDNPRTVVVVGDATYTATFAVDRYTIAVQPNNPSYGHVSGGGTYDYMQPVTLTATPYTGYRFVGWSNGVTTTPYSFPAVEDVNLTAIFQAEEDPTEYYTLTVVSADPAMGTVEGGGVYAEGETVTISATANSGYHFVRWQDGNTSASRNVTVTSDATYTAYFEADAVGIDDVYASQQPVLSPNPASSMVSISNLCEQARIEFFDVAGREVLAVDCQQQTTATVDVSHLDAGTYFVHIISRNDKNNPIVLKLLKID